MQSYMPVQSGSLFPQFLKAHPVIDCLSLYDLLTKDGSGEQYTRKPVTIHVSAIKQRAAAV